MSGELTWGEWIADELVRVGMTQDQFAAATGIGQGTVSNWVGGKTAKPRRLAIPAIAKALGRTVDEVLFHAGYRGGRAYVDPHERFIEMRETAAYYESHRDLLQLQRQLQSAMDTLQRILDDRGAVIKDGSL